MHAAGFAFVTAQFVAILSRLIEYSLQDGRHSFLSTFVLLMPEKIEMKRRNGWKNLFYEK